VRIVKTEDYASLQDVKKLLVRPHLDEVEVSPGAASRTKAIFGEPLTPEQSVDRILADIKSQGDAGLLRYIQLIDGVDLKPQELLAGPEEMEAAVGQVSEEFLTSLKTAVDNVRAFHERQRENSWFTTDEHGVILGQRVIAMDRVGVYVPGGNAPLISTVVMSAVPALTAGVKEIWMATPLRSGALDPHLLAAAHYCGVTGILKAGGAHAIGAMAFGTATVPAVDKIVGPGNLFVTLAKKRVFGRVGIESLAGPSEVLILADEHASPRYIAADLLSQAEHDWEAASCLITTSEALAKQVEEQLQEQVQTLTTKDVAEVSLDRWGLLVVAENMDEAVELTNIFAAEHLELHVSDPWQIVGRIRHAGAVFMGGLSSEPLGDYVAGPNHILPTNGTARFSSPLMTNDFVKKSSLLWYTTDGLAEAGPHAVRLAQLEGLDAHARAVQFRLDDMDSGEREQ